MDADLTPGAVRTGEKHVPRTLSADGVSEADLTGHGELGEKPCDEVVPRMELAYGAPARTRQQLLTVTRDLREEQVSARVMLQRGAYRMQERIGRIEAASRLIRTFHPSLVIGLVQTPGYIRAMLGDSLPDDEIERIVAARGERQRLLDTDRDFVLIMTEGALRWHVGSPTVMIAQLQHLAEVTRRSNVRLGVIPWTTPARVGALPGFHLYDRRAAIVGTETATAIITDARDIADYEACFASYEALAGYDADARKVLDRLSDEYRTLDR